MTQDNKALYEEAKALVNEEGSSFRLRRAFMNYRNKNLGHEGLYVNFEPENQGSVPPTLITEETFKGGEQTKILASDYAEQEKLLKVNNELAALCSEAGFDLSTPEKFLAFQKKVLDEKNPQQYLVNMHQKVQQVYQAKTPEQLEASSLKNVSDLSGDTFIGIDKNLFYSMIGDRPTHSYMGAMADYDQYTDAEREALVANGKYMKVERANARLGYTNDHMGTNRAAYLKHEVRQVSHGVDVRKNKLHAKMIAGIACFLTVGSFFGKKLEWGFRDWVEQKMMFNERISSLEEDYFPTEASIHRHFRAQEWYYRQFRTVLGTAPDDDDDDDEDEDEEF